MVYEEIAPGSIVCVNNILAGDAPIPVWGIVMEKVPFTSLFVAEKSAAPPGPGHTWPKGQEKTYDLYQKWGQLPSEADENRVAGVRKFWEDSRYVGIRTFGEVFSDLLDRRLGLEIAMQPHVQTFFPEHLELIRYTRNMTHREGGGIPRAFRSVDLHMQIAKTYLEQGCLNTPGDSLSRKGWDLVEQLREGGVPEGGSLK